MLLLLNFSFRHTVISFTGDYLSRYSDIVANKTGMTSPHINLDLLLLYNLSFRVPLLHG